MACPLFRFAPVLAIPLAVRPGFSGRPCHAASNRNRQEQAMTFTTDQLRNSIRQGDCIEVMRQMPSRSVDFILTDPPYLVRYKDRSGRYIANDDNADWLDRLEYIPFLREVGQHFSINRMLSFDSVKLRLDREQSLSFLEFNYMILQAYDFRELASRAGCRLQMGGSDQWGNIVNGIELTRRIDGTTVYGLTSPLITTADGGKMGKT
ncbi:MAG: tyrosine--tRNA ligase, partial [Mesorhizobium sp.]|nr:tyrosine--tRNA ligase [Mesorhizobium sp.]